MAYDDMPNPKRQASAAPFSAAGCPRPMRAGLLAALPVAALLLVFTGIARAQSGSLPPVTITSVKVNTDSAKVEFQPVPGAQDYAIYNISDPNDVKYAGIWHLDADPATWPWSNMQFNVDSNGNPIYPLTVIPNPNGQPAGTTAGWSQYHHIDIPATEIEVNGLQPGVPQTFVVQALDAVGPIGYQSLYNIQNVRTFPLDSDCNTAIGECSLGSNMGCEYWADQIVNGPNVMGTNGQGPYTNKPNVIAQSQPFTITASGIPALPSESAATNVFFDDFSSSSLTPMQNLNVTTGEATQTLTTAAGVYNVLWDHADVTASNAFTDDLHWMPVLFDGYSIESNNPQHVAYSTCATEPQNTVNFANGILHVTFEVDAHTDTRRWVGCAIGPSSDPMQHFDWEEGEAINQSDTGLFFQWENSHLMVAELANGSVNSIVGSCATYEPYPGRYFQNYQFGHGLDNRSRFDVFVSTTQFEVFEDGVSEGTYPLPVALPYAASANVYFTQYAYHTILEQQELSELRPYETFWINIMPYSDERHWNDWGFEVLPASTSWSTLGSLIQMPQPQAPNFGGNPSPVVPPITVTPPPAPENLSSNPGNAQVGLSWQGASNASSYCIYRGNSSGNETLYQTGVTSTNWKDCSVTNGKTYFYYATADNSAGQSGKSNETSATPGGASDPSAPPAPTDLKAIGLLGQVNLTWTYVGPGCTYNVYRGTSPGAESSTPIATGLKVDYFTDRSANITSLHYYTVSATNANGTSGMSNEVRVPFR